MGQPTYYAFAVRALQSKGEEFVLGHEKIRGMQEEICKLHAEHYAETETLYMDEPFDPDYPRYIHAEDAGQFVVFTARRKTGEMIGYLQYYVFRSMHSQKMLQAREDALFLTKDVRGGGLAPTLLEYAEHCLAQLGCTHAGMSSKGPAGGPDLDAWLRRKDYRPVALYYVKKLQLSDEQTRKIQIDAPRKTA